MGSELIRVDPAHTLPVAQPVNLVEMFLNGRSPRTQETYAASLDQFAIFLGLTSGEDAIAVLIRGGAGEAHRVVLSWRASMVDRYSPATIAVRLAAIRSMVKLARQLGLINWSVEVSAPKHQAYRDTRGPDADAWRTLLDAAKARANTPFGARDLALIRLLRDVALRRAEAIALDLADVDLEDNAIRVVGKGKSEPMRMTIPRPVKEALAGWLAVRGPQPGAVFVRLDRGGDPSKAERLHLRTVNKLVGNLGLRADLPKAIKPHMLRHSGITAVLEKNPGNIRAAQRFSRHARVETLMIYDDNREDLAGQMAASISED